MERKKPHRIVTGHYMQEYSDKTIQIFLSAPGFSAPCCFTRLLNQNWDTGTLIAVQVVNSMRAVFWYQWIFLSLSRVTLSG